MKRISLLFIVKDNKALLFKRSATEKTNPSKYGMLGGHIEKGETPEKALEREVKEEAGVVIEKFNFLKKYVNNDVELNVFYTNSFDVDDIKLNKKEHSSFKFFTLEEILEMNADKLIPTNKTVAKDYNKITTKSKKLNEQLNRMKEIMVLITENIETNGYNHYEYLSWKRKNVTLRGITEVGEENNGGAMLGDGLYSAYLSNRELARKYGKVYYLVNAKPKNPKKFNTLNECEVWLHNMYINTLEKNNIEYDRLSANDTFFKFTNIKDEMLKLGYDGIDIKGREMVNYTPKDVLYFSTEQQLKNYYLTLI